MTEIEILRHYARACIHECRLRRKRPEQFQRDFGELVLGWALKARRKIHAIRQTKQPKQLDLFA